jgi:hypothetical protein
MYQPLSYAEYANPRRYGQPTQVIAPDEPPIPQQTHSVLRRDPAPGFHLRDLIERLRPRTPSTNPGEQGRQAR